MCVFVIRGDGWKHLERDRGDLGTRVASAREEEAHPAPRGHRLTTRLGVSASVFYRVGFSGACLCYERASP